MDSWCRSVLERVDCNTASFWLAESKLSIYHTNSKVLAKILILYENFLAIFRSDKDLPISVKSVETLNFVFILQHPLPPFPKPMLGAICTDIRNCADIRNCTTLNRGAGGLENHPHVDAFEADEPVKYCIVSFSEVSQLLLTQFSEVPDYSYAGRSGLFSKNSWTDWQFLRRSNSNQISKIAEDFRRFPRKIRRCFKYS